MMPLPTGATITQLTSTLLDRANDKFKIEPCMFSGVGAPMLGKKYIYGECKSLTGYDSYDYNKQLLREFLKLKVEILCLRNPTFMQIFGFGQDCEDVVKSILNDSEISLNNGNLNVCDVFRDGLAAALANNDYL